MRKPKSIWSKINKQSVDKLIKENLIRPAGLASVEIAKLNGSWNALDLSDNLIKPSELQELFEKYNAAKVNFEGFPVSAQRNALQWIYDAKTEETKLRRVKQIVEAANKNKRLR